ncbi:MAG: PKD domain-containing protein [Chloroflexi bacterium]|nr:PKD domain-containing protein [Chloroflexota bacterium]
MKLQNKPLSALLTAITILGPAFIAASCTAPAPPIPASAPAANRPPLIQSINGSSDWEPQAEGDFTCVATDPDGDNLTYAWSTDNGTIKGNGASAIWTSPPAMGKYHISVTVSDGKGGEASAVQEVRVVINADGSVSQDAPVVLKMSFPSKETVTVAGRMRIWTAIPIECIVDSPDAKNLKYTWSAASGRFQAARGLSLEGGTASRVNWISPGAGGDYTVNVTVTDSSGNEAKGQVNFKVICCTTE